MAEKRRPSVLVIAYACSPQMGSEHGAGWGVVTALMEFAAVTVLTGSRHIDEIRDWEKRNPESKATFVEVPDRILGPRVRWHRVPEFLHYLTWLRRAGKKARHLIVDGHYDVAFHATFSAFWLPTPAVNLGLPSVWGPVGGAVTTPKPLLKLLGFAGIVQEVLDYASVRLMAALPSPRRTALAATERILQNEDTRAMLPPAARGRTRIVNHALFSVIPQFPAEPDGGYVLWVSPMESRKGPQLALEALSRTGDHVHLKMVGDGPQRKRLERAATDMGIAERVTFTGLVPRDEAVRLMRGASTVLFTGLREEGGLALAEAMYAARRVIVLDHGGAGAIARSATDPSRVALIAPDDVGTTASRLAEAIEDHLAATPVSDKPLLDRAGAVTELAAAVEAARHS
jgi:glycosyltransferase involved in cell wall biosynthesis